MSGYWKALGRAALGTLGRAEPVPHSIHEPDEPGEAGFEIEDEERLTPASTPAEEPQARADIRPEPSLAERPRQAPARTAPADEGDEQDASHVFEHAAAPALTPAAAANEELGTSPPFVSRLLTVTEREVHRIERREIGVEAVPGPAMPVPLPSPPEYSRFGSEEAPEPVIKHSAGVVTELPPAVAAEPLSPAAAEAVQQGSLSSEPQLPLIVEIDRIEVRILSENPAPAPVSSRRETAAAPSLADYLAQCTGSGR